MSKGYLSGVGEGPLSGSPLRTLVDDLVAYDRQRVGLVPADRDYVTLTADARLLADEIYRRVHPKVGSRAAGTTLTRQIDSHAAATTWLARADDGAPSVTKIFPTGRLLDAGAISRFVDGTEAMRRLRPFQGGCPYLVSVNRVDETRLAWSTDLVRRGSLQTSPWTRWSARQRLDFLTQLVEGMAVVHRRGAVHGALRPSNVLVGDGNCPRISDTGGLSGGEAAGWDVFLCPRLGRQDSRPDPRSDVYALGILGLAMICDLRIDAGLARSVQSVDLSIVPRKLAEVLARATSPDPRSRFPSAMEMLPPLKSGSGRWVALQLRRAGVGA